MDSLCDKLRWSDCDQLVCIAKKVENGNSEYNESEDTESVYSESEDNTSKCNQFMENIRSKYDKKSYLLCKHANSKAFVAHLKVSDKALAKSQINTSSEIDYELLGKTILNI